MFGFVVRITGVIVAVTWMLCTMLLGTLALNHHENNMHAVKLVITRTLMALPDTYSTSLLNISQSLSDIFCAMCLLYVFCALYTHFNYMFIFFSLHIGHYIILHHVLYFICTIVRLSHSLLKATWLDLTWAYQCKNHPFYQTVKSNRLPAWIESDRIFPWIGMVRCQ